MTVSNSSSSVPVRHVHPTHVAHFVIRTNRFREVVDWYLKFFDAEIVFSNESISFLRWDDEHHRLAIASMPELVDHNALAAGIDHVAFSYASLEDLIFTYERLRGLGIPPLFTINHGPTTSLYYRDPGGAQIELQTDNTEIAGGAHGFFKSETFALNPIGVQFDMEVLAAKFRSGVPVAELMKQGLTP